MADELSQPKPGKPGERATGKTVNQTANANLPGSDNPNHPDLSRASESKGNHWGTLIFVLLVIAAAVAALFVFRGKKPKPVVPPPVSVTVTNVQKGDIAVAVTSLGSVQPLYTASMSPRVDGQIIAVNYTEGQMVASNDVLAAIDPGPYQAALSQATGQLERDKALLEGANVDLKRYHAAYEKKAIPQQQVDDQVALVHQDEGTVKFDEGQVENAKVQLAYTTIRAPFAGRVGLRLADPGNIVHAANTNPMVVVAQLQPITVVFNVAEDYLPQIQEQLQAGQADASPSIEENTNPESRQQAATAHQMTVEAWDRADENKIAVGKVLALDNMIDSATGTVRLKAVFDNDNLELFPNQFVNAKLIIKTLHGVNLIPTFAIQHNPDGAFVYVLTHTPPTNNAGTNNGAGSGKGYAKDAAAESSPPSTNAAGTNFAWVTMRDITTGTVDGNTTAISRGLRPGEMIAVDNFNKLGEGTKVVPRKAEEAGRVHGKGGTNYSAGSFGKSSGGAKDAE